ncbi:MAG: DUF3194 domain-containing protein, partial [Candidatus Bathyarchaeota archaeon]|nr:DUF3194 domain-containing protein [Candidatus Bathyarchaeota archaeon]
MEEIGISELTVEQLEKLCEIGEKAARDYILSKVSARRITTLDITVDTEGSKPVTVNVEVEITLSLIMKDFDVEKLTKEAVEKAFEAVKQY